MLDGMGVETGVSLGSLSDASPSSRRRLDHPLPSRYAQAVAAGGKKPEAGDQGLEVTADRGV